jgi:hypothetical protein
MVKKIAQSTEPLDAQSIGNGLYGLQGMSSDVREVREVLAQIVAKVAQSTEPLDAQAIGNGLYGLRGHSLSFEWEPLLSRMLSMQFLADRPALRDVLCVFQSCLLVSFDRRTPLYKSLGRLQLTSKLHAAVETLRGAFGSLVAAEASSGAFQSDAEREYAKAISAVAEAKLPSKTSVTFNAYLECFEADVVVRLVSTKGVETVLNIEIDGPHHKRTRSARFCALRDEYLEVSHSIKVVRIDLMSKAVQHSTPHAVIAKLLGPYSAGG